MFFFLPCALGAFSGHGAAGTAAAAAPAALFQAADSQNGQYKDTRQNQNVQYCTHIFSFQ